MLKARVTHQPSKGELHHKYNIGEAPAQEQRRGKVMKTTNLSESDQQLISEKNSLIDRLSGFEDCMNKAQTLVGYMIQEYNARDINVLRNKLYYEAINVMSFIEIAFDYVSSAHEGIVAWQEELDNQVDLISGDAGRQGA